MQVSALVKNASVLAGVTAANSEIRDFHATQGLDMLNEILSMWGSLGNYLSYYTNLTVNLETGKYIYPVAPVITLLQEANMRSVSPTSVMYILTQASDAQFNTFDFSISTIPQYVYLGKEEVFIDQQSTQKGTNIYFYPTPNNNYTANLSVKNNLFEVSLEDNLSEVPDYALRYLRYLLASDYIDLHKTVPSDDFYNKLSKIEKIFKRANPKDASVKTQNPFYRNILMRPRNYYVG